MSETPATDAGFTRLRVEAQTVTATRSHTDGRALVLAVSNPKPQEQQSVEYWRDLAKKAEERLTYLNNQLRDTAQAADEARARFTKYKQRLDNAQQQVNDLQAALIRVSAERDQYKDRLTDLERAKRMAWELFQELSA